MIRKHTLVAVAALFMALLGPGPARAGGTLLPPVGAAISQHFSAPSGPYGPGHRGIDYAVAGGTVVTAAGDGEVTFAGEVPGGMAVSIDHGGGLATTYSLLAEVLVAGGDSVRAGAAVGQAGESHPGRPGLHFGVKVEGEYVDPETLLVDTDVASGISLMPVGYEPMRFAGREFDLRALTGRTPDHCVETAGQFAAPGPPNDNILVTVAGLTSSSNGEILTSLPGRLGYPPERTFPFSYRGIDEVDLHQDYEARDTFGDIRVAAGKLQQLLVEIGRRHPGEEIDLVAHSQGGIVVRTALELLPRPNDMPHVEHVATLASPHRGAPLAAAARDVDVGWGGLLSWAIELSGASVPSLHDAAVQQLIPGSELLDELRSAPRPFGTRYLSLAVANDVIVPADRALQPGADRTGVLGPETWQGHSAIVGSREARGRLFDHLRDGPVTCRGVWDAIGPWLGAGIGVLERGLALVFP